MKLVIILMLIQVTELSRKRQFTCTSQYVVACKNHVYEHLFEDTSLIKLEADYDKLENSAVDKGYVEVIVGADEVAVAVSQSGTTHALVNLDPVQTTFFLECQDSIINYNSSTSDFNVWKDL